MFVPTLRSISCGCMGLALFVAFTVVDTASAQYCCPLPLCCPLPPVPFPPPQLALPKAELSPQQSTVRYPESPERYAVSLRYRIEGGRNLRIRQWNAMLEYLDGIGMVIDEGEDFDFQVFDLYANTLSGTIPASAARQLLRDPRIETVWLTPAGYPIPAQPPVRVLIELRRGLPFLTQKALSEQVEARLRRLGFLPNIGYDNRDFTILRGTIPGTRLPVLLKDLRGQPSGWLLPDTPYVATPSPLADAVPIQLVEVFADRTDAPPPLPGGSILPPIPDDANAIKLTAELRRVLAENDAANQPGQLDVMFDATVDLREKRWRQQLRRLDPRIAVEGIMGQRVTLSVPAMQYALALMQLPKVLFVDLPPQASATIPEALRERLPVRDPLEWSRLEDLQALCYTGKGLRIAIIDVDFSGYTIAVDQGLLREPVLVDLTALEDPQLLPAPSMVVDDYGPGTRAAMVAAQAAPGADLVLIRIDPRAPYQLRDVALQMVGKGGALESLQSRLDAIDQAQDDLVSAAQAAQAAYEKAFDNFDDTPEAQAARQAARQGVNAIADRRQALREQMTRWTNLQQQIEHLRGIPIAVNALVWNRGLPLDGGSVLSRTLNDLVGKVRAPVVQNGYKIPAKPFWVQAAGDTRGQSWMGYFRDRNENNAVEFRDPDCALPPGSWTPELLFLAQDQPGSAPQVELEAGTRLRVTLQWREAHDATIKDSNDVYYRQPLIRYEMLLLRQRDPSGQFFPTDELELAALTETPARRLAFAPEYGVYEKTLDVIVPANGRYCLRVEGLLPPSTRPPELPTIPAAERKSEPTLRLFVEKVTNSPLPTDRIVFSDNLPFFGGVGVPADARYVLTVGSAFDERQPRRFSAVSAGPNRCLLVKPDVLAFDQLLLPNEETAKVGTRYAAAFSGGMAACLLQSGAPRSWFQKALGIPPGHVLVIPHEWLGTRRVPPPELSTLEHP